jgi:hypothetical protein
VEQLASEFLPAVFAKRLKPDIQKIHFVTHSMGGIVVRQYHAGIGDARIGRIVMLAPPNQGSELADLLARHRLSRWLVGPNLLLMGTTADAIPRRLPPVKGEVGVIAGDRPWRTRSPALEMPHDGKVSVAATRITGMTDHLTVNASHSFLMWRKVVIRQISAFLERGHFDRHPD